MSGCAPPAGGVALDDVDVARSAVVQGVVRRGGTPVGGAYVRLLDASGEFTAEVPTDEQGIFRFFAAGGRWTVRTLAPGADVVDRTVQASVGSITEVEVDLG